MSIEATQRRLYLRTIYNKKPSRLANSKDCSSLIALAKKSTPNTVLYSASISKKNQIMTRISAIESVVLFATITIVVLLASIISIECHIKRTQYHEQVSFIRD